MILSRTGDMTDCLGDFGPLGLSVQYTQDVRGCPPAHTGRLWLSVSTHITSFAVCVCLYVFSTHRTSVAVHQSTYQHAGPWTQHAGPSRGLFGDFGPRGLSVQYTQDVRGCAPAHTGRLWLSVSIHRLSVAVRVCMCVSVSTHRTSVAVHQYTYQHGDFGPRGLSVQYTQNVSGYPSAHTGRPCVSVSTHKTSVTVRVCPSAHTERLWLSISTHISMLVLRLSTLTLHDVRGCPPAHTGSPWLSVSTHRTSVAVHVCPCVSVSTHRTSVAVHQYTYQHAGPWTQHAGPCCGLFGTSVGVRQHTHDVCVCPSAHTGCPLLSVCVCVCPSAHTGRLWLSISTQISKLVLGLSRVTLPVDCSGRLWLSASTHRTSVAVRECPSVSVSTHMTSVAVHHTLALPVDCSGDFGPRGLSVQYTQDVCGYPPANTV
ncbi:hypothetical protein IGI04_023501 [Brassica rapa subsp. trilocularis]|uniref:Uncharacterized protein n=1 Tax=Brassica rapa subsp. trilocularis TaxID=1813537 RepID=A0ABQ7M670_BRACM|nr:hypothetical protein IGI04_023501 [Brassica rapa subsp. trilocularis]